MIEVVTFLALSPSPYMITPQPTAQYVQVWRVSVVRASLKWRVSASTSVGEKPSMARLEPARPAALTLKNCLRFMSMNGLLPLLEPPVGSTAALRGARALERTLLEMELVLVSITQK